MADGGATSQATITVADLIALCAVDTELFGQQFFGGAFRMPSADFHKEMDAALDDAGSPWVNINAFRGSSKTTRLRRFMAKRVAYNLSQTILFVGASEPHATRSITWLKNRIARKEPGSGAVVRTQFAEVYGLYPGGKWNENEIEILHSLTGRTIWCLGIGATGSVRGIIPDDYRPDLIVCDDLLTDENASTPEQRKKIVNLVFGALLESLAPQTEAPNAKFAILQTPQNGEDVAAVAAKHPLFRTLTFPCWTPETVDLPVGQQRSAWEVRYPTPTLQAKKQAAINMMQYSIFAREMECRLITSETAAFKPEWLRYRTAPPEPMYTLLAIDPVPPPTPIQIAKGFAKRDYEAIAAVGRKHGEYHVLEYRASRGHDPTWTMANAFDMARRWRVLGIVVETVAYQATLHYLLRKEMERRGVFYSIIEWPPKGATRDTRKKFHRIVGSLKGIAESGRLYIDKQMVEFIAQFGAYPSVPHDDVLDAVAMGFAAMISPRLEGVVEDYEDLDSSDYKELEFAVRAP